MRRWNAVVILAGCFALRAEDAAKKAAPSYSVSGVVNSVSFAAGSFAPYTPATIFGTELSLTAAEAALVQGGIPIELAGVTVSLGGQSAPLFYVSANQINFLIPPATAEGEVRLRVIRAGVAGPEVVVTIGNVAPTLFRTGSDLAIATHADGSLITRESPARPGEIVVVYATGLGQTKAEPPARFLPAAPSEILRLQEFRVLLDGAPVDPSRILYAGITPRSAGLYQVNVLLPESLGTDPEVRISIGNLASVAGLKLAVR